MTLTPDQGAGREEERPTNGQLNNPLDPETLRGLAQLAAWENMSYSGPAPEPDESPSPTAKPIEYEEPPGPGASEEEIRNWGLRGLAARDQMMYSDNGPAQTSGTNEEEEQDSQTSEEE